MTAHINTRWHLLLAAGGSLCLRCPLGRRAFYRSATVDDLFVRLTVNLTRVRAV